MENGMRVGIVRNTMLMHGNTIMVIRIKYSQESENRPHPLTN